MDLYALFDGCSISHLLAGISSDFSQADHMDFGRAQTPRGQGHVYRDVSAAYHDDLAMDIDGLLLVRQAQELDAGHDAFSVFVLKADLPAALRAAANIDRVKGSP